MNRWTYGSIFASVLVVGMAAGMGDTDGAPPSFDLTWNTVDGGGGKSTGGTFEVTGTIGQPDASTAAMTGGNFSLSGGFWPAAAPVIDTCPPDCAPPPNGDGFVNVNDLLLVISSFGNCPGCPADINNDNVVNVIDLLAVIQNFGPCP